MPGARFDAVQPIPVFIPDPFQSRIFRHERFLEDDSADPSSFRVEDENPPAAEVPADRRPGRMDGAPGRNIPGVEPEKWAGLGVGIEYRAICVKQAFIGVDPHPGAFPGVHIFNEKFSIRVFFPDTVDKPHVRAAFPALRTFKNQEACLLHNFVWGIAGYSQVGIFPGLPKRYPECSGMMSGS